ncbi:MAG TPA: valine--tRNA ligase [Candidatus Saccharimonadales bacterium]|nr:valine--tRNA ligase [Candidatus Saccharimonadales bacterium]
MQLPKTYEPGEYEADIYALWEQSGAFTADPTSNKERFSIAMPPPNETGTLSIGHALFLTLQDIMARYNRLQGKDVLWLPGTDHAALPVNAIIEKKLADEGTNKHEIGRDEFLRRTVEFVTQSRGTMLGQMRAMGASCDWSRLRYTLDDALNRCVNETFAKMYSDGLIYRGARIVNWDPNLQTTISDDEVEYAEETTPFYTFKYGPFEIGTARPETKFGDKYVVMHPDDKRYKKYKHGDTFVAEWINGPITATVIKDEAIDPKFGTGVMTITPWHSLADFEIAERHGLDKVQVIDFHGKLLPIAEEFAGMNIAEARPKMVEKLAKKGLLVKTDDNYVHNIARNERGKGTIEPQIKLQWWVDVNKPAVEWKGKRCSLKEVMQSVVREGDIEIMPARFEKVYFHWIDNLRDWCISRQIWWGHRIPAWHRSHADGTTETYVGLKPPIDDESEGWNQWEQDPDTLDTWFSSALWTWSTLIDPKLTDDYSLSLGDLLRMSPDFQAYHPTSVLETGWDILFFWVARMILSTTYMTGQVPFKTVYLHGMVRAADGQKMSKSRPESIIDPLDVIPKYGTDALRMALIMGVTPGNDQNWGWGKIEANRNFCNKLWNIARYTEGALGEGYIPGGTPEPQSLADHWVLQMLQHSTDMIAKHLDKYRFSEAYEVLYHFVWDEVADWYIEASKSQKSREVLGYVLESVLKLAHPFAPFVTEAIWQTLYSNTDSLLITSHWPKIIKADKVAAAQFEELRAIVTESRAIIRTLGLSKPNLYYHDVPFLAENAELLTRMSGLNSVSEVASGTGLKLTSTHHNCWLDVDSAALKAYADKVGEQIAAQEKAIAQLQGRLDNKGYVANAPKKVVDETRDQLAEAKAALERLHTEHTRFEQS